MLDIFNNESAVWQKNSIVPFQAYILRQNRHLRTHLHLNKLKNRFTFLADLKTASRSETSYPWKKSYKNFKVEEAIKELRVGQMERIKDLKEQPLYALAQLV